jgi:hypothetical protein
VQQSHGREFLQHVPREGRDVRLAALIALFEGIQHFVVARGIFPVVVEQAILLQ